MLSRSGLIWCRDDRRAGVLLDPAHPLNGIDYVEFRRDLTAVPERQFRVEITFLKTPPAVPAVSAGDITVEGGIRVVGLTVLDVEPVPGEPLRLVAFLSQEGDYSTYTLTIAHPEVDIERGSARFSFKAGCPTPFDCRVRFDCPEPDFEEPGLDYMAKDYQSFRFQAFELIEARNPGWQERAPADLGVALVETIAYAADYLSYYQDALAAEGYLDLCRSRISALRHGTLVWYPAHNGRSASSFVQLQVGPGPDAAVPVGTQFLTRVGRALRGQPAAPGPQITVTPDYEGDPALADVTVFEATARVQRVRAAHNVLRLHDWGDAQCCLARGARQANLFGVDAAGQAFAPVFEPGDYLLIAEAVSPVTGLAADADPGRRQVVRLIEVESAADPAHTDQLTAGALTPRLNPGAEAPLPLQRVVWREADALDFALCLSAETPETGPIAPVSLAHGNTIPCDHGRTVRRNLGPPEPGAPRWPQPVFALPDAPLVFHVPPESVRIAADGRDLSERHALHAPANEAVPAVTLVVSFQTGPAELWTPIPSLLEAGAFDPHFVVEIENEGEARLRCGDNVHGLRPDTATGAEAVYRIGGGRAGNLGRGSLVHVVTPPPAWQFDPVDPLAPPDPFPEVLAVRHALPAIRGEDRESLMEIQQFAPEAFRAWLRRAVTEADWTEVARRLEPVAAARAQILWTGSWYTIFIALHPRDEHHLRRLPGGSVALEDDFAAEMSARLTAFKIAGFDLKVLAANYVPLEIDIEICVAHGHLRGDVLRAVTDRLSNRDLPDGTRGFFHRLNFAFGEPLYLSALYAALEATDGVSSARVTRFNRYWEIDTGGALERGVLEVGPGEIIRLDNEPSAPEWGVLRLSALGGL